MKNDILTRKAQQAEGEQKRVNQELVRFKQENQALQRQILGQPAGGAPLPVPRKLSSAGSPVSRGGVATPPPAVPTSGSAPSPVPAGAKKPGGKKAVLVSVAALVLVAGGYFGVANFTNLLKPKDSGLSFAELNKVTFPDLDDGVKAVQVGEAIPVDDLRLTFTELKADKITGYDEALGVEVPKTGDFLVLEYRLENTSIDRNYFLSQLWKNAHLIGPDGEKEDLEMDDLATIRKLGVDTVRTPAVKPGSVRTGRVAFRLPSKGANKFRFVVEPSILKGSAGSEAMEVDEDGHVTMNEGELSELTQGSISTGFETPSFALDFERADIEGIETASSDRASLQSE